MSENANVNKSGAGLVVSTSLVAGNMIGSGIFLLPASLAVYGGISLYGWIFSTTGALLLALVFSRLSRLVKKPGGPYAYSKSAFGKFAGFLVAWGYWISIWCGNAAIAVAGVGYLSVFFPILKESNAIAGLSAVSMIAFFTIINTTNYKSIGYVQLITTILKLTPLVIIGTVGFFYFNPEHFTPFNNSSESSMDAITSTASLTLWAFLGLESATIPSDKIKNPQKTIPLATILGTLISAFVYISSSIAIMGILKPEDLINSTAPYADSALIIFGKKGELLIAAGAAISCMGALNGWILLQGQLPYAAAQDGVFPQLFLKTNIKRIPIPGLLISSALACVLVGLNFAKGLSGMFTFMIKLSTLTILFPYLLSSFAELIITSKRRTSISKRKFSGLSLLSISAFLYSFWAVMGLGSEIVYLGFILLMFGIPVYVIIKQKVAKKTL